MQCMYTRSSSPNPRDYVMSPTRLRSVHVSILLTACHPKVSAQPLLCNLRVSTHSQCQANTRLPTSNAEDPKPLSPILEVLLIRNDPSRRSTRLEWNTFLPLDRREDLLEGAAEGPVCTQTELVPGSRTGYWRGRAGREPTGERCGQYAHHL
jgi:hypothetical protein